MATARRNQPLAGEWQDHAGAAGFGGLRHLSEPLSHFPVRNFYLLEMPEDDLARRWFEERGVDLEQDLLQTGVREVQVWRAELWDPIQVARRLVVGMQEHDLDVLHVNVSSGPNTVAVGATLASFFWDIHLYHAKADYLTSGKIQESVKGGPIVEVSRLPRFRATPPRSESLAALTALTDHGELPSSRWKQELVENHSVIRPKGKTAERKTMSPQAIHGQFEALVRPLVEAGLVAEQWAYGKRRFKITDQGKAFALLFEGNHAPTNRTVLGSANL